LTNETNYIILKTGGKMDIEFNVEIVRKGKWYIARAPGLDLGFLGTGKFLVFNVDGFEALNVGTLLDVDYNIASRTGLHCAPLIHEHLGAVEIHGAVRFGIGPFNTEEHINTAIEAVKEIAAMKRK
jgi:selenocysteine lyase/cysteine desulfurase